MKTVTFQQSDFGLPVKEKGGRPFTTIVQSYSENSNVVIDDHCNCWIAVNKGTKTAFVQGFPLNAPLDPTLSGESLSMPGWPGEEYKGRIQIDMDPTDSNPLIFIIQKIYIP